MAKNREFIAAKDLPVAESSKVSALVIDEHGELRQKPNARFGGGGGSGGGFDVIFYSMPNINHHELIIGDYESIKAKFDENKPILAMCVESYAYEEDGQIMNQYHMGYGFANQIYLSNSEWEIDDGVFVVPESLVFAFGSYGVYFNPDNTLVYQSWD